MAKARKDVRCRYREQMAQHDRILRSIQRSRQRVLKKKATSIDLAFGFVHFKESYVAVSIPFAATAMPSSPMLIKCCDQQGSAYLGQTRTSETSI